MLTDYNPMSCFSLFFDGLDRQKSKTSKLILLIEQNSFCKLTDSTLCLACSCFFVGLDRPEALEPVLFGFIVYV